ncbi:hypothetical protein B0H12DRAFT_1073141 [Mycena haematopus]|nr:hypothetical protein B0H12DRAFT_1073141 [Mycena haematopus]
MYTEMRKWAGGGCESGGERSCESCNGVGGGAESGASCSGSQQLREAESESRKQQQRTSGAVRRVQKQPSRKEAGVWASRRAARRHLQHAGGSGGWAAAVKCTVGCPLPTDEVRGGGVQQRWAWGDHRINAAAAVQRQRRSRAGCESGEAGAKAAVKRGVAARAVSMNAAGLGCNSSRQYKHSRAAVALHWQPRREAAVVQSVTRASEKRRRRRVHVRNAAEAVRERCAHLIRAQWVVIQAARGKGERREVIRRAARRCQINRSISRCRYASSPPSATYPLGK